MIVVVGQPKYCATENGAFADGMAARIGLAAAAQGRTVQLVGKVGEDPEGDAVVLALARGRVGHVAILRDAGTPTSRATDPVTDDPGAHDEDPGNLVVDLEPADAATAGTPLDAADVELGLRYLTEFDVLVLAERAGPDVVGAIVAAAAWQAARLIVVLAPGQPDPSGLPAEAVVFEAPEADPDGVFAGMVGSFAAALDRGKDPAAAFQAAVGETGWSPAAPD